MWHGLGNCHVAVLENSNIINIPHHDLMQQRLGCILEKWEASPRKKNEFNHR
jgi:hypothetical protein